MAVSKADSKKMQRLAQEGKTISRIVEENFPKLSYKEVYTEVYDAGGRSSLGTKRMISNRMKSLLEAKDQADRKALTGEIKDLVLHLYESHKKNTEKLATIREALGE